MIAKPPLFKSIDEEFQSESLYLSVAELKSIVKDLDDGAIIWMGLGDKARPIQKMTASDSYLLLS